MNYSKPEVRVLGDATVAIQGSGQQSADQPEPLIPVDCELDD